MGTPGTAALASTPALDSLDEQWERLSKLAALPTPASSGARGILPGGGGRHGAGVGGAFHTPTPRGGGGGGGGGGVHDHTPPETSPLRDSRGPHVDAVDDAFLGTVTRRLIEARRIPGDGGHPRDASAASSTPSLVLPDVAPTQKERLSKEIIAARMELDDLLTECETRRAEMDERERALDRYQIELAERERLYPQLTSAERALRER